MNHMLIPPREPGHPEPVRSRIICAEKKMKREYKQIVQDLDSEKPLDVEELNMPGEDGWEMTGIAQQPPMAYFYFKRQIEK